MNKTKKILLALFLGLGLIWGSAHAADLKFGYVDLGRIFTEYKKTVEYDKGLNEKQNLYEAERDKKVNEVKNLQDKLSLLSEKEKETKKGDLETKVKALQDFDRQKQTDLRKEQDDKMKEVLKDIEEVVKKYAQNQGYTMVFNDRVLVYQEKSMDITDKVVEILNKEYKGK